jgi:hypothetical protein
MGYTGNLIIIFLVISISLNLVNPDKWGSPLAELITGNKNTGYADINESISTSGLWNMITDPTNKGLLALVGVGGATALVLALAGQGEYALFAGFTIFMLGFIAVPINFFIDSSIPISIRLIVGLPFAVMYFLSILGWFRGSDL